MCETTEISPLFLPLPVLRLSAPKILSSPSKPFTSITIPVNNAIQKPYPTKKNPNQVAL
jgi:hypothetical protein